MRSHTPTPRLRDFDIGDKVKFKNDNRDFVIREKRKDGYYELSHKVTACSGHECEAIK
jgi:hypothetical protein